MRKMIPTDLVLTLPNIFDMKSTKTTKHNQVHGYKIALLKRNENQTYTFELKKKIPTYRPNFFFGMLQ